MTPSFAFVRQPETNGVAERFIRTLKEQVVWGRIFRNAEEVRAAVRAFVARYNEHWLLEKNASRSPAQTRREWFAALAPIRAAAYSVVREVGIRLRDTGAVGSCVELNALRCSRILCPENPGRYRPSSRRREPSFIDGGPADWQTLPVPEGRIVVSLDGGYVRDWVERKRNFEIIVGRSLPEDREARYLGLVHGYDRKPKRRLVDVLTSQGLQANQDIT